MAEDPNKSVEEELERGGQLIEEETEWGMGFVIVLLLFMLALIWFGAKWFL